MVAFGRPKGDRGSYRQWEEGQIPPQVVFEILSPGNTLREMAKKQAFYDRYGVEEYYIYDPDRNDLNGFLRGDDQLEVIDAIDDWVSPRLGIRFELGEEELTIFSPTGQRFLTPIELAKEREHAQQQAERSQAALEAERQKARALAEKLRLLAVDPDSL